MKAEKLYREAQEFFGKNHETNVILVAAVERIEKVKGLRSLSFFALCGSLRSCNKAGNISELV